MIAAANFSSASWISSRRSKRIRSLPKPANQRPLHHPPVFAQPLAALNASSGNPANDAPLPQVGSASLEVVAFVGVQLCRSSTGTSWQASNRRNRVHAPLEHLGVVPVRAADQDHQRDASGIYNDVSLGAELASVRRVGPRCLAPPGAWYRGAINAASAPIDLVMFTQASQHGLVQLFPHTSGIPVAQAPPASHAATVPKRLGKVFPWNACLQHEQDAVESGFIADCELAGTTFGGRYEGWDERL